MSKRLVEDDAQALDLLLEHGGTAAEPVAGSFLSSLSESVVNRVGIVESVLRLFGEMPSPEPPADLVAKTLARVKKADQRLVTAQMDDAKQPPVSP